MKKIWVLILAAALVLSLAACRNTTRSSENLQDILASETWVSSSGDNTTMQFTSDGNGHYESGMYSYDFTWTLDNSTVTVTFPTGEANYTLSSNNSVYELVPEVNQDFTLVRQSDFANETQEESSSGNNNWSVEQTVDEFGDATENSETLIRTSISGDFSNTATASSELAGYVFVTTYSGGTNSAFVFRLLEYGKHQVTFTSSDVDEGIVLKVKIGDTISEYPLTGEAPNGDLYLLDSYKNRLFNLLYDGREDIRCIITIGSSQYNFTIKYGNFADVCEEAFHISADGVTSIQGALAAFSNRNMHRERYSYITENIDEFPILTTDEIQDVIVGHWLSISVETFIYDDWWIFEFSSDGIRSQVGRFVDAEFETTDPYEAPYTIENDLLYLETSVGERTYQFRKLLDGYYLVLENPSGSDFDHLYVYVQYTEDGQPKYTF